MPLSSARFVLPHLSLGYDWFLHNTHLAMVSSSSPLTLRWLVSPPTWRSSNLGADWFFCKKNCCAKTKAYRGFKND